MPLYHFVPKDMRGHVLYPLNQLKEIYPDLYMEYIKKYEGREHVMEQRIPQLDCVWNDVLFLVALSPDRIQEALATLGLEREFTYYEIDPYILSPQKTVVYTYSRNIPNTLKTETDFVSYNPDDVEKWAYLKDETIAYFKEKLEKGERPLVYHMVPHILYKGSIDVTKLPIRKTSAG